MRDEWRNQIIEGDSFAVLDELPEASVHAVVTDPPYGLAFMGRDWDDFEPKEYQEWCERWASDVRRVLKPGGHLLAFSGNRTHHRLFTGVEDAGFEIRDTLTWHYGSGFPKASDVSKTIDKRADAERVDLGPNPNAVGRSYNKTGGDYNDDHKENRAEQDRITKPPTDAAKKWDGWKTGLKPATEFVVMARKPFDGATVDSVLEHGTGALNIDACRVDNVPESEAWEGDDGFSECDGKALEGSQSGELNTQNSGLSTDGRYPANVVFDETAAAALDREVGESKGSPESWSRGDTEEYGNDFHPREANEDFTGYGDSGGPSRYFYTSKASRSERTENGAIDNDHPTVKPIDLMEWLIKLVTREGQTVLDPFAGSGTTCKAAKGLGRQFLGIEQQPRYADIARVRCGLTPDDPAVVRSDDAQQGFEAYTDGGDSSAE